MLNAIQTESRSGLNEEVRTKLLLKYEVGEDLAALAPPRLNKEIVAALAPSVIKRDEYQSLLQAQVGACFNIFDSPFRDRHHPARRTHSLGIRRLSGTHSCTIQYHQQQFRHYLLLYRNLLSKSIPILFAPGGIFASAIRNLSILHLFFKCYNS